MPEDTVVRLCEWSAVSVSPDLSPGQRRNITDAAKKWQELNHLPEPPLWFSGPEGKTLHARQYIGVIELPDVVIEVYPKLDKHLLKQEKIEDKDIVGSVMSDLLWLLDVSGHFGVSEIDQAGLKESPTSFYDVFALLLAKHLRAQLLLGLPHSYITVNDDIGMIRGKICILDQIARNMNRRDLVSCEWDEFTADTPMNRLFKCSCRFLLSNVRDDASRKALMDCIVQYDDISDVDPRTALTGVASHRWDRRTERFRNIFDLAVRLLRGIGHLLTSADTSTFVFLIDMNQLFEDYVKVLLEAYFDVGIESQKHVGWLFPHLPKGKVQQRADYFWQASGSGVWIADAKYKHLSEDQPRSLMFDQVSEEEAISVMPAGRVLSSGDIRQLTVYAELEGRRQKLITPPTILLLYPYVYDGEAKYDATEAWNSSPFIICPVRMNRQDRLENALPVGLKQFSLVQMMRSYHRKL